MGIYTATAAPGLTFQHFGVDGGDLLAAAATMGVPHPTGYPTYTLLAWCFTHLPVGNMAYRGNMMSALCSAVAVALVCLAARRLLPASPSRPLIAACTALSLAASSLFWSQAVITEVYALLGLFAASLLWLVSRWRSQGGDSALLCAAFLLGLGLGNHVTLLFFVPAGVILLWPHRKRWLRLRLVLPALLLLLLGLGVYAYLPLAAAGRPPVNWGNPETARGFLWVVTAKQYQPFAFGLDSSMMLGRLSGWAVLLGDQFGWWGLLVALAGAWACLRGDRSYALSMLAWTTLVVTYAFFYDTGDSEVYLLPIVMVLAIFWGQGVHYLQLRTGHLPSHWRRPILAILLLLPLLSLGQHWHTVDLHDDRSAMVYIDEALDAVEPDSLVVVRKDQPTFALWYAVYADGRRPDIAIVNSSLLAYIWYRDQVRHLYPEVILVEPGAVDVTTDDLVRDLLVRNLTLRPIYATDPAQTWSEWFDFVQDSGTPVYRVEPKSLWRSGG